MIGAFVLAARPRSPLHIGFFLFALADGASTILYELRDMAVDDATKVWAMFLYFGAFIAFVVLLLGFGLLFPRPAVPPRAVPFLVGGLALVGVLAATVYSLDHTLFWRAVRQNGVVAFPQTVAGRLVLTLFVLATFLVLARMMIETRRSTSPSRRRQSALVLGGMAFAYAPYATTSVIFGLREGASASFLSSQPATAVAYWGYALILATVILVAADVALRRDVPERRVIGACLGGVLVLTLLAVAVPGSTPVAQNLGLLAYPTLLGYAILRYDALDIDARLRKAAVAGLATAAVAVLFVIAESLVQQSLEARVGGVVGSLTIAAIVAALVSAALALPFARAARRIARRVAPAPTQDELARRRIEIYRHSLEGALEDGLDPEENRALDRLRESLGLTIEDHAAVVAGIRAQQPTTS